MWSGAFSGAFSGTMKMISHMKLFFKNDPWGRFLEVREIGNGVNSSHFAIALIEAAHWRCDMARWEKLLESIFERNIRLGSTEGPQAVFCLSSPSPHSPSMQKYSPSGWLISFQKSVMTDDYKIRHIYRCRLFSVSLAWGTPVWLLQEIECWTR